MYKNKHVLLGRDIEYLENSEMHILTVGIYIIIKCLL